MSTPESGAPTPPRKAKLWQQLLPWGITLACFAYLYGRMSGGAAAQGLSGPSACPASSGLYAGGCGRWWASCSRFSPPSPT